MSQAYEMLRRCRRWQTVGLDAGADLQLTELLRREKIIDRMPEAPDSPVRLPEDADEGFWP